MLLSLVPHLCPALRRAFFHLAKGIDAGQGADMTDHAELKRILQRARVIAVVGLSTNPVRPSYFVARYLSMKGYRVIPVNPGAAGETLFGETIRGTLSDCPPEVDMLDIFRRSDQVLPIVRDALEHLPALRTIWMQIGVRNEDAATLARDRGLDVVQDMCPKIEYQRLFGELRMGGINTGIISSRL
jgi:predicted CoA-binding protein